MSFVMLSAKLLEAFTPQECLNSFRNYGYVQT
jgi:hypothetical protein